MSIDDDRGSAPTDQTYRGRNPLRRLRAAWRHDLGRDERAGILAWASFTTTFAATRALTHWIRDGHGPAGGGMSLGGNHFHHYNIGIATLSALAGWSTVMGERRPGSVVQPTAYGFANALIVDEAALLLDLKDVYWAKQGRTSVDLAVGTIGVGGMAITAQPLLRRAAARRP